MGTYDLIGFDMDGTILNSKKAISARTLDAINRAAASGTKVILSTGRCFSELEEFEETLTNVRYYVCESGALIYDTSEKRVLHSASVNRSLQFHSEKNELCGDGKSFLNGFCAEIRPCIRPIFGIFHKVCNVC